MATDIQLREQYEVLCADYEAYALRHQDVENTQKLRRRVARDLAALDKFIAPSASDGELDDVWAEQRKNQLQGFRNNYVNYYEKLRVAKGLKDVVALGKVLQYPHSFGSSKKDEREVEAAKKPVKVEIDIVANGGNAWVQVRTVRIIDLDSLHWIGMPGHHKGLEHKLKDLVKVSQAFEHSIRWSAPDVVVYCSEGFGEDVSEEIQRLGGHPISGDLSNLASIPKPPDAPTVTNLDVTALCALISEVSYGDPYSTEMIEWGRQNTHWQNCIEHEQKDRLMTHLEPLLHNRQLIVADQAMEQFESLLHIFKGPHESERWEKLKPRLTVYETVNEHTSISRRMRGVDDITELQRSVFGLGDSQQALTVTCNQKLVNKLKQMGIQLECCVHRPVWLTGF